MTTINDMELMQKMLMFMRKTRMEMGGHGMPGMGGMRGPHPCGGFAGRPPMPPGRPPMPPHGHPCGPHRRPPLSREHLLVIISKYPDGVRQKEIADQVGINQSSASELINKLESTGYIDRKVDPNDKRATLLTLTEKGQARAAEVEDERNAMFVGIFAKLTDDEKQTLSDLLDKLLASDPEKDA